jgi:2,4'-dihydroxyacetophenone dioxygenase
MHGRWRYLEHDWVARPRRFIYEAVGEALSLVITDDSLEPVVIFLSSRAGLIYLAKTVNGGLLPTRVGTPSSH